MISASGFCAGCVCPWQSWPHLDESYPHRWNKSDGSNIVNPESFTCNFLGAEPRGRPRILQAFVAGRIGCSINVDDHTIHNKPRNFQCLRDRMSVSEFIYANRRRFNPRAVMREASVVGFMPNSSAAPCRPKTFPPVCSNAAAIF